MPHYLFVKDRLKGFRKARNQSYSSVVKRIAAVILFRDRMNMSKLPGRRISRTKETQMKEFDQAGSKFENTVFENKNRDSIPTVWLPKIKASKGMENVIMKNFNFRNDVVRG